MITYVYFINKIAASDYKIGITNNLNRRLRQIQTGNPHPLQITHYIESETRGQAIKIEREIHHLLAVTKMVGEWFRLDHSVIDDLSQIYDIKGYYCEN